MTDAGPHIDWLLEHPKCMQALSEAVEGKLTSWGVGSGTLSALKKRQLVFALPRLGSGERAYEATKLGKRVWELHCKHHRPESAF